tara:strand:+ start:42 stop:752 length:711 start_codon:yes stop_codon:yes gene_type:complete
MKTNSNIGAIIFSRFDSNRLFGKALKEIEGRSLLGRVIDRTKRIRGINKIILATSIRKIDDGICDFAESEGIEIFRGSCDDVYGRALETCKKFNLDIFARICGDRPFFDYDLTSQAINISKENNFDLITTMFPRAYPPGLTVEIIKQDLLKIFDNQICDKYDREHLTTYFYKNPQNIKINNLRNPKYESIKHISLVVDTVKDYERAKWIAKHKIKDGEINEIDSIISLALRYEGHN